MSGWMMAAQFAGQALQGTAQGIQGWGTAAGDLITAQGDTQAAALFGQAATIAGQSATEAQAVGKLQEVQTARQVMMTQGSVTAAAAAGGLRIGGSAAAIIRSNAYQGALAHSLIAENTQINVNSYMQQQIADQEQQESATSAASAAESGAGYAKIGGIIGGIGTAL